MPLDIVVASKIGAPGDPECAVGAVASDGSVGQFYERFEQVSDEQAMAYLHTEP